MKKLSKVVIAICSLCAIVGIVGCRGNENSDSIYSSYSESAEAQQGCTHDFQEEVERYVAPTCSTIGEKLLHCTKCGESKREILAKLPHTEVELLDEYESTCTEQGYKVYACLECGDNYATFTEAKGHTPNGDGAIHAVGCLTDGYTEYQCQECHKIYQSSWVVKTGHAYGEVAENIAATCSNIGYTVKVCAYCGDRLEEKTQGKLAHDFSKGSTCTVCSIGKEAIWVTYGGGLDAVEYVNGVYTVNNAKDGQILHISAEAVCNLFENGCNKVLLSFDNKENQATAFNAQYNGVDNAYNIGFNFSIALTEEMKQEGIDIMMYYHTRGWADDSAKAETDGFKFSITGIKAFNEADKLSWFVCDNMGVAYDKASDAWTFTPNDDAPMEGYHHPCFSLDMIEKYKSEGKTKLTLTVGTINNERVGIQFDIPRGSGANIGGVYGTTTVEIDLNNLPSNTFFSVDGYFALRCYVNGNIQGLVITISVS